MSESFEVSFASDTESEEENEKEEIKVVEKKHALEAHDAKPAMNGVASDNTTICGTVNGEKEISAEATFSFSISESSITESSSTEIAPTKSVSSDVKASKEVSEQKSSSHSITQSSKQGLASDDSKSSITNTAKSAAATINETATEHDEKTKEKKHKSKEKKEKHANSDEKPVNQDICDVIISTEAITESKRGCNFRNQNGDHKADNTLVDLGEISREGKQSAPEASNSKSRDTECSVSDTTSLASSVELSTSQLAKNKKAGHFSEISNQTCNIAEQKNTDSLIMEMEKRTASKLTMDETDITNLSKETDSDVSDKKLDKGEEVKVKVQMEPTMPISAAEMKTHSTANEAETLDKRYESILNSKRELFSGERNQVRSVEKTTTVVAEDELSTQDLIKRILAEAGGGVQLSAATRQRYEFNSDENRSVENDVRRDTGTTHRQTAESATDGQDKEPSLLERRLASIEKDQVDHHGLEHKSQSTDYRVSRQENRISRQEEGYQYQSSGRGLRSDQPYRVEDEHQTFSRDPPPARAGLLQKQQHVSEADEWENRSVGYGGYSRGADNRMARNQYYDDDEDDEEDSYSRMRRRQMEEEVLPDEDFVPMKGVDTDLVVQEKTEDIRRVVENQDAVLKKLKGASDSFDELDTEIRAIREQFIESQMRRSMILDDLQYERMCVEQMEREQEMGPRRVGAGRSRGEQDYGYEESDYSSRRAQFGGGRKYGAGLYRPGDDEDPDYDTYSSPIGRRRPGVEDDPRMQLDKDLESDSLTRGSLSGLALRGDTQRVKTAYEEERRGYTDRASRYSLMDDYAPTGGKRRGRSMSMFEQDDLDLGDVRGSSYRTDIQRRRAAGFVTADDADEPISAYRTPNLPSYRKYDINSAADDTSSTSSSRYGLGKRTTAGDINSYDLETTSSFPSSRAGIGKFARAKTLDYGASSTSSYRSPGGRLGLSNTKPSFNSRFLNKVREKKASGEDITCDKSRTSRFLGKSFDTPSSFGIGSTRSPSTPASRDDTTGD